MAKPIEIKGVIQGKTIVLDEETFLPDGYPVTLHLILTPEEALRLSAGAWADMTPEQVAEFEELMSDLRGRPVELPERDAS